MVTVQQLWNASKVARRLREVRRTQGTCVVGGAKSIQRMWRQYRMRPSVVYVPNTEEVPQWCLQDELPTYIVRCPPVEVKRHLLSAEYSDGYAAEFPVAPHHVRSAVSLLDPSDATDTPAKATLALVGLRIPSNQGQLLWAAVENGFERVILVNCVDVLNEKVVRASQGSVFDPRLEVYEYNMEEHSCVPLLCSIAMAHRLLPILTVPSQDAPPAFEVARGFHRHNRKLEEKVDTRECMAPLLVLGSEVRGLADLEGEWTVPHVTTTLPLPNALIDSYNVGVAGSILLNLFRPAARDHFATVDQRCGESGSTDLFRENDAYDELEAGSGGFSADGKREQ
ncbi:hypothetical protein AGDE_10582 [Angomonas deanei]|uniref:SpoU rRNA Methylase family, putative n=1 Tax=Angomonas deanei TaxID=59799 RepID=A0A7G2CIV5_9TRYP|nr:hypothetical protein AGDE_10582 [Angomonas deanei]CAD2219780.1 SpoU rRNA Methylase family, putative [Angomonas deanei]|eukprot:EPY28037.1 hypothetical protein AGDE_10582 [Angomonas deanei]